MGLTSQQENGLVIRAPFDMPSSQWISCGGRPASINGRRLLDIVQLF